LHNQQLDEGLRRYKAGIFFNQVGDESSTLEQANWINNHPSVSPAALVWAKTMLGGSEVVKLEPDWTVPHSVSGCVQDWTIVGFNVGKEILDAGVEVVLDLYWAPICGESSESYGMEDIGSYWVQAGYIGKNLMINPGFEWRLPKGNSTLLGSSSTCCEIVEMPDSAGFALQIREDRLPATRAAQQSHNRDIESPGAYLVGGNIKWGEVHVDGDVAAVIGGFWLDEHGSRLTGDNNAINNLQEFIVEYGPRESTSGSSGWISRASIVYSSPGATKFAPWIGLTSAFEGSAELFVDNLFVVSVTPPIRKK
jgi:hypothetical protein